MSRIGRLPISIPDGVKIEVEKGLIRVVGPKGSLERKLPQQVRVDVVDNQISVSAKKGSKAIHGTVRAIIANMVQGVSTGWSKTLELVGAGYRAEVAGSTLTLAVGHSHPVKINAPPEIFFKVEKTDVTVQGIDKELVGQVAAKIRAVRPPEPYKGKGIRYKDEIIRRKPGKAAKAEGVGTVG